MIERKRHAPAVVLMSLLVAGCGEGEPDAGPDTTYGAPEQATSASPEAPPAAGPKISVDADKTHAVQPGDELTLTIDVSGFTLAGGKIGGANEQGVGHYRIYLDDASGDDYLASGAAPTTKVRVPESITDGTHDLRVVLYNNDETQVEPRVEGSVLLIVYRL